LSAESVDDGCDDFDDLAVRLSEEDIGEAGEADFVNVIYGRPLGRMGSPISSLRLLVDRIDTRLHVDPVSAILLMSSRMRRSPSIPSQRPQP
jgi:hypothetical protein